MTPAASRITVQTQPQPVAAGRRLFFALWPQDTDRAQLQAASAPLLRGVAGNALGSSDWHVTLCFLGAVGEAGLAALCARAALIRSPPFELQFVQLEYWRSARLIAATAPHAPAAAIELARALWAAARSAGLTPDDKPWRAHLTLMRGVSARRAPQLPSGRIWPLPALLLQATRFYLAESQQLGSPAGSEAQAARYRVLASWPLAC